MSINTPAPAARPAGPQHPAASPAGPGAARARIHRLHQDGSTYQAIATAAGLAPATVRDLASGRRRPARGTAAAVLAVNAVAMPRSRLDAGGTRLRLRALHVMGHGSARLARALGVRETAISELVRGDARTISPKLRDKVTALYDAWWDKRPPNAPAPSAAPPPPPAAGPSPGTGAPPPPSMTPCSTPLATGPARAGNPPPAPASLPTSARPLAIIGRTAHDQR